MERERERERERDDTILWAFLSRIINGFQGQGFRFCRARGREGTQSLCFLSWITDKMMLKIKPFCLVVLPYNCFVEFGLMLPLRVCLNITII